MTSIVWFRQDLRLRDNLALHAGAKRDGAASPCAIADLRESREAALNAYAEMRAHRST